MRTLTFAASFLAASALASAFAQESVPPAQGTPLSFRQTCEHQIPTGPGVSPQCVWHIEGDAHAGMNVTGTRNAGYAMCHAKDANGDCTDADLSQ